MQTKTMRCNTKSREIEVKRNNTVEEEHRDGSIVSIFHAIYTLFPVTRGITCFRSRSPDSVGFKGKLQRVANGDQPGDTCSLFKINEL